MRIKQFYIYLADLEPSFGTETGKIRPVVVIQTDLLNSVSHRSTIICPLTTNLVNEDEAFPLRISLGKKDTNLKTNSDIIVDQIRTIDNKRFIRPIGKLNVKQRSKLINNLKIVLFE